MFILKSLGQTILNFLYFIPVIKHLHIKTLKIKKERGKTMAFFTTTITTLKTVVTALVAVWGVVNLLEGYGNDNLGANAHVR